MTYRFVIFDFDGTLADSFPWFVGAVNRLADRHGFRRIEPSDIGELRGCDAATVIARLGVPAWKLPVIAQEMRRAMAEDIDQIRLFDGVDAMLRRLSEVGVRTAILTSNARSNVERVLGAENAELISHYACGASLFGKQAKLRRLLSRVAVPRAEVLCVGDEIRDLQAARREGVPFGAVAWGYTSGPALEAHAPDEFFRSPAEVGTGVVTAQASP